MECTKNRVFLLSWVLFVTTEQSESISGLLLFALVLYTEILFSSWIIVLLDLDGGQWLNSCWDANNRGKAFSLFVLRGSKSIYEK